MAANCAIPLPMVPAPQTQMVFISYMPINLCQS
jgi:hypothetical protein